MLLGRPGAARASPLSAQGLSVRSSRATAADPVGGALLSPAVGLALPALGGSGAPGGWAPWHPALPCMFESLAESLAPAVLLQVFFLSAEAHPAAHPP